MSRQGLNNAFEGIHFVDVILEMLLKLVGIVQILLRQKINPSG
jgi:hypothetical protein